MKALGISIPLTVSIGLFYVHKECIYTEREIESFANHATTTAKNAGKNRIEVFEDKSIPASQCSQPARQLRRAKRRRVTRVIYRRFARGRIPAVTRPTAIRLREARAKNQAVNIDTPLRGGELPPGLAA